MGFKVDKRFNERIWKAQKEIVDAFSELSEDVSLGNLSYRNSNFALHQIYKEKADQARVLLNNTLDSLEGSYKIIQEKCQDNDRQDLKRLSELD